MFTPTTFLMPCSHLRNRLNHIQFASIFIAVLMTHIVVIQSVWSHPVNTFAHIKNISFLESFEIQAEDTAQAKDTIQSQHTHPDETSIQDGFSEARENEMTPLAASISTEASLAPPSAQLLEPEGTHTSQNSIAKIIKRTNTTRNAHSINSKTEDAKTHITPPSAHASLLSNPPPPYPRQSRRLGEQGKVVLKAEIATNGTALQALVNISSGYPRLDRAALESVLKWQFIPGKKAGVTQKMWVIIPINFVLE